MAEVLTPIVQQSSSITMLHTSPDAFPSATVAQSHHQPSRISQMPRNNIYNTQSGYRGTAATPVAPYAFQTTPHLRLENRTASAPVNPYGQELSHGTHRQGHPSSSSASTVSSTGSSSNQSLPRQQVVSKDDSMVQSTQRPTTAPDSQHASMIQLSTSVPDLSLSSFDMPAKPSPDRYRRGIRRVDSSASSPVIQQHEAGPSSRPQTPTGSGMASVGHLYRGVPQINVKTAHHVRTASDDMNVPRQGSTEQAKRYRRRSVGSFEPDALMGAPATSVEPPASGWSTVPNKQDARAVRSTAQPNRASFHEKQTSGGSVSANGAATRPSSSRRNSGTHGSPRASVQPVPAPVRHEVKTVNIPPRGSSEANKRLNSPSPLSRPMDVGSENILPKDMSLKATTASELGLTPPSPAAQHLAALSDKDLNKGMKSRLRRAFSFGSAAELRRASAENNLSAERAKLRKERYENEREAHDAAIAAQQEAAGIGAGIYSGQGNVFTGSTDNLSISSTASSASLMLRKMGKGMKKSTRSLKGLFRPKSVVGVPPADGPVTQPVTQPSMAQVSMVTVEAEREKVNVNANPHDQAGGGTGFPHLERNSIDAVSVTAGESIGSSSISGGGAESWTRRSIVGGEKERAEVLTAVKKSILKRSGVNSGNSSPVVRPADNRTAEFGLPNVPHVADTPTSTGPNTPDDTHPSNNRVEISGEDYFMGVARFAGVSSKSLPNTPQGTIRALPRNISFAQRVQFHEAWSSTEYDRRGDIATCNRLTPMLAQQIKEELNSFKMEMEVHELSKPHTHFF